MVHKVQKYQKFNSLTKIKCAFDTFNHGLIHKYNWSKSINLFFNNFTD